MKHILRFFRGAGLLLLLAALALFTLCGCTPELPLPSGFSQEAGSPAASPPDSGVAPAATVPIIAAPTELPTTASQETTLPEPETTVPPPVEDESWKLLLVNASHPVPKGYDVTLKALRNGQYVDERIYPELQQMFDDARAQEIYPLINESYRSAERQQDILDKYTASYEANGYGHDAALQKALETVALPGTSEHQLGLALDIVSEYGGNSVVWDWLRENCWKYGFILRYPQDKAELTGISYEPWHFRYVGVQAAREITEQGLCLEEYLAQQGN